MTAVLPAGLNVDVVPRPQPVGNVFDVTVEAGSGRHRFFGGWAGEGWPGDVDRLLIAAPKLKVVFARHLSEGAKAKLAERHIGWVDESGQANITLPSGLVVSRETSQTIKPPVTSTRWTATMLTATEAIFAGIPPTVEAIEISTRMSRGAAAKAMSRLEERGLLARPQAKRGRGVSRQIVDIDALIDDYAAAAAELRAKQRPIRVHRLMANPLDALATKIGPNLTAFGVTWAVTGVGASVLLAPYLSDVTVIELYVDRAHFGRKDLADIVGGREVTKGHLIEVRELPSVISAQGPNVDGIQVALPARVYADLMAAGGRLAEAAQHLREVRGVGPSAQ
jgi:hypothetical protein